MWWWNFVKTFLVIGRKSTNKSFEIAKLLLKVHSILSCPIIPFLFVHVESLHYQWSFCMHHASHRSIHVRMCYYMFDVDLFMSMSFMPNAWGVAQRTLHDHILFTVFTTENSWTAGNFLLRLYYNPPGLKLELGLWVSGYLPLNPLNFTASEASPMALSIPTSQAMEWWDPSPCSWRANSAAAKIKGSLANFVSAGSYRKEFRGWPLAPLELTFAHLQTDLMYIWCNCFYKYDVIGILGVYGVLE